MKPKHADDGMYCPLWKKPCVKVCHTCEFWGHIRGKHPATGQDMDQWMCGYKMQNMLTLEGILVGRQTTATVDALRKEVHTSNDQGMVGAIKAINDKVSIVAETVSPSKLIGN